MAFIDNLLIKIFSENIGVDRFGNRYYLSKNVDYLGNKKRYVIYNGQNEPSKIPSGWHAWLHYLSDRPPTSENTVFSWQKDYLPNLTGTKYAYDPAKNPNKKISVYVPWKSK